MSISKQACSVLLFAMVTAVTSRPAVAADSIMVTADEKAVRQAADQFYTALNALFQGDVAPMEAVWSHADDVTYMGPDGGMQIGWKQVLADWQLQASKKLGGNITATSTHIVAGPKLAVVTCYEVGDNVVRGEKENVHIRATNIFRKENGQWKMIGHHTDPLAFLD